MFFLICVKRSIRLKGDGNFTTAIENAIHGNHITLITNVHGNR